MKRKSRIIIPILAFVLIAAGCTKDDAKKNQNDQTKEDGFTELVPEKPDYVKADLSYYGSGGFETSDYWQTVLRCRSTITGHLIQTC